MDVHNLMEEVVSYRINKLYNQVKEEDIEILVNCAGFGVFGEFTTTSLDKELDMIDTNIKGLHILTKLFLQEFTKRNRGYILNVASSAAFQPGPLMAGYYASKAYVLRLSESIYGELKEIKSNVGISVLCPGPVDTEFANVASLGARKVVKDGKSPDKVVAHCLKSISRRKYISIMALKWKFKAFMSRFISKIWFARYTFKHEKRPSN